MAVEQPGDFVVLELNQLFVEPDDTLTFSGAEYTVVSRSDDRRQLVLRPPAAKKAAAKKAADEPKAAKGKGG